MDSCDAVQCQYSPHLRTLRSSSIPSSLVKPLAMLSQFLFTESENVASLSFWSTRDFCSHGAQLKTPGHESISTRFSFPVDYLKKPVPLTVLSLRKRLGRWKSRESTQALVR